MAVDDLVGGANMFIEQLFRRRVRLRCDGEPATVAFREKLKERIPRQDSQAYPAKSKANRADLSTIARALRGACRIVTPGEAKPDSIDELTH